MRKASSAGSVRDKGEVSGRVGCLDLALDKAQQLGPAIVARRGAYEFTRVPGDGSCFYSCLARGCEAFGLTAGEWREVLGGRRGDDEWAEEGHVYLAAHYPRDDLM